jgi:hypothetical protein
MKQQLIITMLPNGSLHVEGPIEHKMLCYGMLGMAHDLIKDYVPSKLLKPISDGIQVTSN